MNNQKVGKELECSILVQETPSHFADTPAFTLIMFVLQITFGMIVVVLLLLIFAPRMHPFVGSLAWHSH